MPPRKQRISGDLPRVDVLEFYDECIDGVEHRDRLKDAVRISSLDPVGIDEHAHILQARTFTESTEDLLGLLREEKILRIALPGKNQRRHQRGDLYFTRMWENAASGGSSYFAREKYFFSGVQ